LWRGLGIPSWGFCFPSAAALISFRRLCFPAVGFAFVRRNMDIARRKGAGENPLAEQGVNN
jgi:hypothetical protein